MKKLLLYISVIVFGSSAWGQEDLSGINLNCIYNDNKSSTGSFFLFQKAGKVSSKNISSLPPFPILLNLYKYWSDNNYVHIYSGWMTAGFNYDSGEMYDYWLKARINRKTLVLSKLKPINSSETKKKFSESGICKIVDIEYINNALNKRQKEIIKKYKEKLKKEEEKNRRERDGNQF